MSLIPHKMAMVVALLFPFELCYLYVHDDNQVARRAAWEEEEGGISTVGPCWDPIFSSAFVGMESPRNMTDSKFIFYYQDTTCPHTHFLHPTQAQKKKVLS